MTELTAKDFRWQYCARKEDGGIAFRVDATARDGQWAAFDHRGDFLGWRTDGEMAAHGWETALIATILTPLLRDTPAMTARAQRAEDTLALVQQQRDQAAARAEKAERSRDLALARAERAECHDCVADAAVIEQPPARPEWADLADVIRGTTYHPEPDDLARALHHEGVRVVTEEGR